MWNANGIPRPTLTHDAHDYFNNNSSNIKSKRIAITSHILLFDKYKTSLNVYYALNDDVSERIF